MRQDLPAGTVTFLFTDVEGSTKLLHELGAERYAGALAEHRRAIREVCSAQGGVEVDTQGDAFFFAFPTAPGALAAASAFTDALAQGPIQVRVGLHTGTPLLAEEGYVGDDVHFAARVAAASHGGQVVVSSATAELVDLPLTDLGEHRLKDIAEPVPIFQLGNRSFPPLKTISNTNLPRPASSFVGREEELEKVLSRIKAGVRLLTLTGPGGTGKTRLALEAASTLVPEYKAGVFWIGLASLRDPALVTETIAQTLGAKDSLPEHIGERELLLLVDNLEHVIDSASELSSLLEKCSNLTLLVTSRELLRVRGEVEYPVPPLAEPEAVSLFCERSALESSEEIGELCARLDALPLAVELAAARTTALSPAQILARLSSRLDLLKGGRDADPRQQTLRATIEWSHELLTDGEQQLFRNLAVFAGGCTLEAAGEVCDADLDTLQSLVEKSLLRFSNERYWMLETIRQYAGEQLTVAGCLDEALAKLRRFVLAHVGVAEGFDLGFLPAEWYDMFREELPNVREALASALEAGRVREAATLSVSLYSYALVRGGLAEASVWLDRVSEAPLDLADRLTILGAQSDARLRLGDASRAISIAREHVSVAGTAGDEKALLAGLRKLGHGQMATGDVQGAEKSYRESLALARKHADLIGTAAALNNLGFVAISQARWEEGLRFSREGAEIFDRLEDREGMAVARFNEAFALVRLGRFEAARPLFEGALSIADELEWREGQLFPIEALGALAVLEGEFERGAHLLGFGAQLRDDLALGEEPIHAALIEEAIRTCQEALGRASCAAILSDGASLPVQEAVRLALGLRDGDPPG
ncbi:MAG TPA: adenylate/guanylate cyclase domain-containing protein [Gaiellaceae bacterium]|nr:adenylate/guanylate cyclase domain-containing protein [Gaiellaceae bacterium]